ncbi:YrhB family protein [Actinoplanes hulinensis]|uniref:YrhB family protein n=1 Tax=Actinoplanes hulinensis TaxID=1144547 RepID=A0ABS7BGP6_9ACTN|nr:YrhB domain-containing protein [Actinoplanes hulinensis]MBW6440065.1 YrhB family protein [Actinoplanes hulinensis]
MIDRDRAIALVEAQLAEERQAQPHLPELAIVHVEEHEFGWLLVWQSAAYARSRDLRDRLIGQGPYLVDGLDGSIHHIPVTVYCRDEWLQLYRERIRGEPKPDPVLATARELLRDEGTMAVLRHLRAVAPRRTLSETKAYADALRDGGEPPADLVERTRPVLTGRQPDFQTLTGPCPMEA